MTQRAIFRDFCVCLKRVLFACVVCVFFGSIAEAGSIVEPVVGPDDVTVKYECASYGGVQSISTSGYPNPVMLALNANYSVDISLANNYCNPTNNWVPKLIRCYKQSDGSNFVVETSGPIDTSTSDEYVCTIYYQPKGTNFTINEIYNCEHKLMCTLYFIENNAYLNYDADTGPQNPISTNADIAEACNYDENYITSCYAGLSFEACDGSGVCNNAGFSLAHAATNSYNEWLNNMQYDHARTYFPSYLDYHHAIRLNSPDADSGEHGTGFVWYCSEEDVLDSNQNVYLLNNCPGPVGCYGQTSGLYPFLRNLSCCHIGCYMDPGTYPWHHPGYQVDFTQLLISPNNQNTGYKVEIPQRSGYVFVGYYDTPDGTAGTQYVDAYGKLTLDGLTAAKDMVGSISTACGQWEAHWCPVGRTVNYSDGTCGSFETHTITLNKNGGTGGSSSVYSKYSVGVYLYNNNGTLSGQMLTSNSNAITLPTRSGYTFLGYYASTSSSAQQYINSNGKITQNGINAGKGYTSNAVWYAKWASNTPASDYTVIYNCNNGNSSQNQTGTYAEGETVTVPASNVNCTAPNGYSLAGWYCSYGSNNIALSVANSAPYAVYVRENYIKLNNNQFQIQQNTDCIAIWQQDNTCPNNGQPVEYILNQEATNSSINLNENVGSGSNSAEGKTVFSYGTVYNDGLCSSTPGVPGIAGQPSQSFGQYCWCRINRYVPTEGAEMSFADITDWVYLNAGCQQDDYDCRGRCMEAIAGLSVNGINNESFREILYSNYLCRYNVGYDCNGGTGNIASTSVTVGIDYQLNSVSGCTAPNGQQLVNSGDDDIIGGGWMCEAQNGGTNNGLLNTPDYLEAVSGTWTAQDNYTCRAQWESNTCSSGTWWSDVTNQCEPGYTINLVIPSGIVQPDSGPVPTTLYTIQNTGAYLDAARTQLMVPNDTNGQGGQNPIELPVKTREIGYDTNEPTNPVTGQQYESVNPDTGVSPYVVPSTVMEVGYGCFRIPGGGQYDCAIDKTNGYITADGAYNAEIVGDKTWRIQDAGYGSRYTNTAPTLTGYTCNGWYDNSEGTGSAISMIRASNLIDPQFSTLYAKWTPKTYTISYVLNNGTYGANHPESATYDSEFTVSNPTRTGYTFLGWTITGMDGVTHYYSADPIISNDVYQGATTTTLTSLSNVTATHFMNLRSATGTVTFNAQWENDTYLLTYAINAPNGLSINEPSENPVSVNAGQNRPLAAIPMGVGYTCSEWICATSPDGDPVAVNNNTISEMPASNVLCTTSCRRNLVGLGWNTDDADNDTTVQNASPISCVYGTVDGIFPIQTPVKHGYTFVGWTISNWASGSQYNFLTLNTSDDGIERWAKAYSDSADYCWYDTNARSASNVPCTSDSNFDELERYQWKVKFGHGDVYGTSRCSSTSGTNNETGNPSTNAGKYCWCMATGYKQSNSSALNGPATEMPWVMRYTGSNTSGCRKNCAAYCSYNTEYTPVFRSVLYGL